MSVYELYSKLVLPETATHKCRCRFASGELLRLRQVCKELFLIIEHSADTLFVTDGQGRILLVNTAYEQLSGERRENLVGRNVADFAGVIYSESATLLTLKSGKPVTIEQKMLHSNRFTYVTSQPIFDPEGNIAMVISNNRDFTEIERLRVKLENTEDLVSKYQREIEAIKARQSAGIELVATDKRTLDVLHKMNKLAHFDTTVLILGETGTGKEEFAKYMHAASDRQDRPFVKVNCGAIAESLMESEFFGYEKGAFTGASHQGKLGLFEVADTGTLFLDEIGELPLDLQVKLLRVLQEKEITRIGGTRPVAVDVRIISATNRDLAEMVRARTFREDLYYRLNVVQVEIPPLKERRDDIIPLAKQFLGEFNRRYGLDKSLSNAVYHALRVYAWPGNVRELRNVIEQAVIMSESDKITLNDLPLAAADPLEDLELGATLDLGRKLRRIEYTYITRAYEQCGNVRDAAASLGMTAATFVRRRRAGRAEFEPDMQHDPRLQQHSP